LAVRPARTAEGCPDVAIGADSVDDTRINVYERWRDRAALEASRDEGADDNQMSTLIKIDVGEYRVPE